MFRYVSNISHVLVPEFRSARVGVLLLLIFPIVVHAHDPFEITTEGRVAMDAITLTSTMSPATAANIIGFTRSQQNEIEAVRDALEDFAPYYWDVIAAGKSLVLRSARVTITVEQELELSSVYAPAGAGSLKVIDNGLARLPYGFGNMLNLTQMSPAVVLAFTLLRPESNTVSVTVLPPTPADMKVAHTDGQCAVTGQPANVMGFTDFILLGIEHILTGYDHLLFLAALLLGYRRLTQMLITVTGFTVGHSLTLSLAVLGFVSAPVRLVETLIALSIVIVALENLLAKGEPRQRFPIATIFGLVHGLGFASVLLGMGLGRDRGSIVPPLLGFNLGVECGQVIAAAIVMPVLLRYTRVGSTGLRAASVVLVLVGAYWVVARALG